MTSIKRKLITMIVVMVVLVGSFVYSTVAYFTSTISSGSNSITAGTASVQLMNAAPSDPNLSIQPDGSIGILPGYTVNKDVSVQNTGTLAVYVRVKLDPQIVLSEKKQGRENEIDLSLITYDIDETKWIQQDGYYHYNGVLKGMSGKLNFISNIHFSKHMGNLYQDSRILLKIRMEIVQANHNGNNVFEATGWQVPSQGGAA